jgi:paraquat-inducible protein A
MRRILASHRKLIVESMAPALDPVGCPDCGFVQALDCHGVRTLSLCRRCRSPLRRSTGRSLDAALAFSAATAILLVPAALEPFLSTSVLGATRASTLPSSVSELWREGWPLLALVVALFVLVLPAIRFAALTVVLAAIRGRLRPRWLGSLFRLANALETWAMLDVFLLGFVVAYARLDSTIYVTVGLGARCFVAAALASLLTRATLDQQRAWQRIGGSARAGAASAILDRPDIASEIASIIACRGCGLLLRPAHERRSCPRCGERVLHRRPEGLSRSIALLSAAALLYLPANLYPIATIPVGFTSVSYTVLGGIKELAVAGFFGLAVLVFCASLAVPLLKMVGLSWCTLSVIRRSRARLVGKTRAYRWLEEIGRWSMVDPFTIACFVPVLHYNSLVDSRAEAAAVPFAAVVILTTLAVRAFDPRLMWDRARLPS